MKLNPKRWMFYDGFKNDDERRLARILSFIILSYLTGSLILILLDLVWGDKSLYFMLILGVLSQLIPFYFLIKRKLSACSFTVTVIDILSVTIFATFGSGIRDYVLIAYPALIIFAGLTEKRRGLVISTLLTLASLTWLVLGDVQGWYEPLVPAAISLFDLLILFLLISISATAVSLLIEHLEDTHAQTKQELKRRINAEENLQALIENTGGSIWSVDTQYKLIIGNTSFHNNIKAASGRELVAGESVLGSEYNKNMLDEWQSYYDRALQGEKFHIQVNTQLSLQPLDMEYHFNPIRDKDGQVSGVTVFGRDITERKQTELQLRESEEQNRAIVNSVPDLLFRLQRNGTIVDYHAPHDSILFTPPEKFLNRNFEDVLPPHVAIPAKEAIEQSLATNQMIMFDYEMEKNGEIRYYEDRIVPVNKEEVLSVIRDITERRWMEKQLRESEERYRRLADHAPDIIFRYNLVPEMRLSYINLAVQSITGYTPDDCYADPHLMLNMAHSDDAWKMAEHLQSKNTPEKPLLMRWVGKDGLIRWMESHIVPIHNSDGQLIAVEGITRDVTERKHAEEKLRESEEFIRNVNNNLFSGMIYQALILKDGSRKFTYLSDSVERLYGISPQQGAQDPSLIYNRIHSEDILRLRKEEEAANQTLSVFKIEVRVINPDGSIRWSSFVSNPTLWEDGTTCWNGIELDITELKTAEEALRASETRYRLLAENISDVIWIYDIIENRTRYISPSVERLRGYTPEEIISGNMASSLTPDSFQYVQKSIAARLKDFQNGKREFYVDELEQTCKNGTTIWTEVTANFQVNPENGHIEIYGVSRDISEKRQTREALLVSEERIRQLVDSAPYSIFGINQNGTIDFANTEAANLLGYSNEELVGKNVDTLLPARYQETHPKLRNTYIEKPYIRQVGTGSNLVAKHKDGTEIPVDIKLSYYRFKGSLQVIAFMQDISDRVKAEKLLQESEARFRLLFETMVQGIVFQSKSGDIISANPAAEHLLGLTLDQMQGRTSMDPRWRTIHEDGSDLPGQEHPAMIALKTGEEVRNVVMGVYNPQLKDYRWINVHAVPQFKPGEQEPHQVFTTFDDVTERRKINEALKASEMRYRLLAENISDVIWILDANEMRFRYVSQSVERLRGYTVDEVLQQKLEEALTPQSFQALQEKLPMYVQEFLDGNTGFHVNEVEQPCKDGSTVWTEATTSFRINEVNSHLEVYGVSRDITERKLNEHVLKQANQELQNHIQKVEQLRHELQEQALHDPLTNLHNRRYLAETLEREVARAQRERNSVSVVIMDIDRFKNINDTYGHQVGDKFLVAIAHLLKLNIRGSDVACRYGGEEFLLVLPGATEKVALKRAKQLREQCAEICIHHEDKDLYIKISIGIATFPTHTGDTEELLIKADKALYQSKRAGRNRVTVWSGS